MQSLLLRFVNGAVVRTLFSVLTDPCPSPCHAVGAPVCPPPDFQALALKVFCTIAFSSEADNWAVEAVRRLLDLMLQSRDQVAAPIVAQIAVRVGFARVLQA